jgi:Concanavalin A-like lectin/glucanases superfamily/Putative amidase domain
MEAGRRFRWTRHLHASPRSAALVVAIVLIGGAIASTISASFGAVRAGDATKGRAPTKVHATDFREIRHQSLDAAPSNTAAPAISGTATQGQSLSADPGTWTNSPTSFAYQWQRCGSGAYSDVVKGDGPVGYWRLDESANTSAVADSVGSSSGTYSGVAVAQTPTAVTTESDKAAYFNGAAYVSVASSSALNRPTGAITLEAWIKPSASQVEPIALKSYTSHVAPYYQYGLFQNGSGIRLDLALNGSNDRSVFTSSGASLTIGGWNHVVANWDGSTVGFYINGSAAGSTAATGTIGTFTTPLDLATYENLRSSGGAYFYTGQIDEVALYDSALSSSQVSAHYAAATTAATICSDISGATSQSYQLAAADVAKTIKVKVTASNAAGSGTATSAATNTVEAASPPANSAVPTITGAAREAQTLTATDGSWTNSPSSYTRQWRRCDSAGANCTDINGATATTYTLASTDVGSTIRIAVTATNAGGSTTETSAPTAVVAADPLPANTSPPVITGTEIQTWTLTTSSGSWQPQPDSISYGWLRCNADGAGCSSIAGATDSSYTLQAEDVGKTLRVTVTARNSRGSTDATSAATGVIQRLASVLIPIPDVDAGVAVAYNGPYISATKWVWDDANGRYVLTYQRRANGEWHGPEIYRCITFVDWPQNTCGNNSPSYDGGTGGSYNFQREIWEDFGPNSSADGVIAMKQGYCGATGTGAPPENTCFLRISDGATATTSGPLDEHAFDYINGTDPYAVTIGAKGARNGLRRLWLERTGAGEIASTALCSPDPCDASLHYTTTVDTSALPEGKQEFSAHWIDGNGDSASGSPWDVYIDRTAPSAPTDFAVQRFIEGEGTATLQWQSSDPDLPGGTPGSGIGKAEYRYQIGTGPWTEWAETPTASLDVPGVQSGDSVTVEVKASDEVGNESAVGTGSVTITPVTPEFDQLPTSDEIPPADSSYDEPDVEYINQDSLNGSWLTNDGSNLDCGVLRCYSYNRLAARKYIYKYLGSTKPCPGGTKNPPAGTACEWGNAGYNPDYHWYRGEDCTNFTSQGLRAGGLPDSVRGGPHSDYAWWYDPTLAWTGLPFASLSWVNAPSFKRFITNRNTPDTYQRATIFFSGRMTFAHYLNQGGINAIEIGDIISIDLHDDTAPVRPTHNMFITKIDANSAGGIDVYVSYHGLNRRDRSLKSIIRQQENISPGGLPPFIWIIHVHDRGQKDPTYPPLP